MVGEFLLRGIYHEEFRKRADLDADLVADLTRGVPPTFDIAQKLAEAMELDELYIQQLAGLVPPGEQALSTEEIHLLHDYRELNNAGRKIVRDLVTSVKENMQ
jgi:RecA/RadA recombinase